MSILVWFRDKIFGKPVDTQITDDVTTKKVTERKSKSTGEKPAKKTSSRKKKN